MRLPILGRQVSILALAVSLGATATAHAEPIAVTTGGFFVDFEGDWMDFGGDGFAIRTNSGTVHIPMSFSNLCFPCLPGDALDLSIATLGEQFLGSGPGTFAGVTHSELFYRGDFSFAATPQTLPDTVDSFLSTQPFVFTGFLRAFTDSTFTTMAFSTALSGRGHTNALFVFSDEGHLPALEHVVPYTFEEQAPVPEPATLLLVGAGMASACLGRVRQKRQQRWHTSK
jgi:hypothetical protein